MCSVAGSGIPTQFYLHGEDHRPSSNTILRNFGCLGWFFRPQRSSWAAFIHRLVASHSDLCFFGAGFNPRQYLVLAPNHFIRRAGFFQYSRPGYRYILFRLYLSCRYSRNWIDLHADWCITVLHHNNIAHYGLPLTGSERCWADVTLRITAATGKNTWTTSANLC
jgi:hypothetical protein